MPTYIVKPERDVDLYVEWSSVVDNIVGWGDLAGMKQSGTEVERLDRADSTGTSALWPEGDEPYLGWNQASLLVTNTNREDAAFFTLRRSDLLAYVRAHIAGDREGAERLLVPIPDDEEVEA